MTSYVILCYSLRVLPDLNINYKLIKSNQNLAEQVRQKSQNVHIHVQEKLNKLILQKAM